jgi:hypothetical protein
MRAILASLLALLIAGCGVLPPTLTPIPPTATIPPTPVPRGPSRGVMTGDSRTAYYFERDAAGFEVFTAEGEAALFRVSDGALEGAVVPDRGYIWSLNDESHRDVIINATVQMTEGDLGSAYGVICRADSAGNGYYFLVSSDGAYSIQAATPVREAFFPLVDWTPSDAVNFGYRANELRVVCVEDYLALFINDVFVAETFDPEFTEGRLGVALGAVRATLWVRFDDILLRDAVMLGERDPYGWITPTPLP